jgi:predicted ester cyclase
VNSRAVLPKLLLLSAVLAGGCGPNDPVTPAQLVLLAGPQGIAGLAARRSVDLAVVQQVAEMYNTGMNGGGWAAADGIYAPDAVFHTPGFPQITDLPSLIAEMSFESEMMLRDFHVVLEDVFGAGDKVVGRFIATAKWILGVPEPMPYVNPWIVVYQIEDGKIVEEWWQYDLVGVQEQVGLLPRTRTQYGWSESSTLTGDPGIPQQNASLARRVIQFVNTGNLVLANHVLAPSLVSHQPDAPMATDRSGFESVVLDVVRAAFPDVHVTINDLVASGDRVGVRFTAKGTHLGTFAGIPATGREVQWTANVIYRMADRQIVEAWTVWDAAGLLQQIMAP